MDGNNSVYLFVKCFNKVSVIYIIQNYLSLFYIHTYKDILDIQIQADGTRIVI